MKRKLYAVLLLCLVIVEAVIFILDGRFNFPILNVLGGFILLMWIWSRSPHFRHLVGEFQNTNRSTFHGQMIIFAFVLFFVPIAILSIKVLFTPVITSSSDSGTMQFNIATIAPTIAGLILTLVSSSVITGVRRKNEAKCVTRKLVSATISFILFSVTFPMVDLLQGIDIFTLDLLTVDAWIRGIYFWIGAACFYGGVFLFILGMVDFIFLLADFNPR